MCGRRLITNAPCRNFDGVHETPRNDVGALPSADAADTVDRLAHDVRQPLAAIVAYATGCRMRMESGALDPQDLARALDGIEREALRAGALLQKLHDETREQRA